MAYDTGLEGLGCPSVCLLTLSTISVSIDVLVAWICGRKVIDHFPTTDICEWE